MRGTTKLVAVLAAVSLAAGACAKKEKVAEDACKAQFGCVTFGAGEPIQVGTLLAISGNVAFLGLDSQRGVQLAIDNLDGKLDGTDGQLLGHAVTLVNEDDGCSKEGGQAGATKLAALPNIIAVIGTSCSSSALGVADKIFGDKGILLVSPSNTNPNLTAEGTHQPYYLRTAHNDRIQGAVVADFAYQKLGARTAATIHDESPYADALAAVFRAAFEKLGGTITVNGNQAIQSTDTNFKPVLTTIAADKPDFLYYPDFDPACALIAKQAKQVAGLENSKLAGSDGCLETAYLQTGGTAVNGTFASGPDLSKLKESSVFKDEFLPTYKKRFGVDPTAAFHAHAYDAANILFEAIKKVAVQDAGGALSIPRAALKDAIFATKDHAGLSGSLTCVSLGDCATAVTIAVYEAPALPVEGGKPDAQPVFSETKTLAEA